MNQKNKFDKLSNSCSKLVTNEYSTSFSLGILLFDKTIRPHIYAIYGFVRLADEIVDSFLEFEQSYLLSEFKKDTYAALEQKISLNPILNSFQYTVNKYNISTDQIDAFLLSMETDLYKSSHSQSTINDYIYGSAEVVGLMCLKVFCIGSNEDYEKMSPFARSLGAAFQKVNFLRDLKDDYEMLGRNYFEDIDFDNFTLAAKQKVEADIELDFVEALKGIKSLPITSRFGVYVAYIYYYALFNKIKRTHYKMVLKSRIRVSNLLKYILLAKCWINYKLKIIK